MAELDKDLLSLFSEKVFDQTAWSVKEFAERKGIGVAQSSIWLKGKVDSGEAEQVWKRVGSRTVQAFRVKR